MSTAHRLSRLAHAALCCVLGQLALPSAAAEAPPPPLPPPPPHFNVPAARAPAAGADAAAVLRSALRSAPLPHADSAADDGVCTDPDELERYSASQYSYHTGARPAAIAYPRSTAQVAALVRACTEHRLALIPRSGGTSLEGHVLPVPQPQSAAAAAGSVVLDFSRMARVLRVNSDDMDVTVQAGVGWLELAEALKPFGLTFPVDPGPGAQVRRARLGVQLPL